MVTGPYDATAPATVAELDLTRFFPLDEGSRQTAVALVPSLDRAMVRPAELTACVDRSTTGLNEGWAIATDERPHATRDAMRAMRRYITGPRVLLANRKDAITTLCQRFNNSQI